jgi:hypothetical protein
MLTINLKDEVQKALNVEWRAFAERHPRLAEALDQTVLVEQAVASIADDPAFRKAMEDASSAGVAATWLTDAVGRFVAEWLKGLI